MPQKQNGACIMHDAVYIRTSCGLIDISDDFAIVLHMLIPAFPSEHISGHKSQEMISVIQRSNTGDCSEPTGELWIVT